MRTFLISILVSLLSSIAMAQVSYQNMVNNGSFEGGDLSNYTAFDWSDGEKHWGRPRVVDDVIQNGNHCAVISTRDLLPDEEELEPFYFQFFITTTEDIEVGEKIRLSMRVRADKPAGCQTSAQAAPGEYLFYDLFGTFDFSTQWETIEREVVVTENHVYGIDNAPGTSDKRLHTITLNLYLLQEENNYYFDDIKFEVERAEDNANWFNFIRNDIYTSDKINIDDDIFTTFSARNGNSIYVEPAQIETDPIDEKPALVVRSAAATYFTDDNEAHLVREDGNDIVLENYVTQFYITTFHKLKAGQTIKLSYDARATLPTQVYTELHKAPTDFVTWGTFGGPWFSSQWDTYVYKKQITSAEEEGQTIAFNLNVLKENANTYYFRNIKYSILETDATAEDHIIGTENLYLPVVEPGQSEMMVPIDFTECQSTLDESSLKNLIKSRSMRVQVGEGTISDSYEATSKTMYINGQGYMDSNGTIKVRVQYNESEDKVYFVIANEGQSFIDKKVKTTFYIEKDGWYYAFNTTFVDSHNYILDTYRTVGIEEIYLPVPEPENNTGAKATIDFTNCLQTFGNSNLWELITGQHMKVQQSDGMLSKEAFSATQNGIAFDLNGSYSASGDIQLRLDENTKSNQVNFIIHNNGSSFVGKTMKSRMCFDQNGKYYVFGLNFLDEEAYSDLTDVRDYTLTVKDENGGELSNGVEITWYDANGQKLGSGSKVYNIKKRTELYYSIQLSNTLGQTYREVKKKKVNKEIGENITCQLTLHQKTARQGKVYAHDGTEIPRATIKVTQWLNSKYETSPYTTMTDANGEFCIEAYNDSTVIEVTAEGYMDLIVKRRELGEKDNLGVLEMDELSGMVVKVDFTYKKAAKAGEETIQAWYNDTKNIEFYIHNATRGTDIDGFAIQQDCIVLPVGCSNGDRINITAHSLNEKFADVTSECTIAQNDTANASFNLVELGGIDVRYVAKNNERLIAMLYDNDGKLQIRTICETSQVRFSGLDAGNYTLVSMGYNGAVGTMPTLSDLSDMGIEEGSDYVCTPIKVYDGTITTTYVTNVPELDASKFEFTGMNTSFTPNKTQMVISNFITLTTRLDFKEQYAKQVKEAKLYIDIPEDCEFIENSVVIGNKPLQHYMDGDRLVINLDEEDLDQRVRFCIYPSKSGVYLTSALAEFDFKGVKSQPIGQIRFEATSGDFYVPSVTRSKQITVAGIGAPKTDVEVYDNEHLIGTTQSMANGRWSLNCELDEAYNLSKHDIYIKYRGEGNITAKTDTKECFYDENGIVVKTVKMLNIAHPAGNLTPTQYTTTWDFNDPYGQQKFYSFWPKYPDITFLVDMTENNPEKVLNVYLYVYTMDGDIRRLEANYSSQKNCFVAHGTFDSYTKPVNVKVEYSSSTPAHADANRISDGINSIDNLKKELNESRDAAELLVDKWSENINTDSADDTLNELWSLLGIEEDDTELIEVPSTLDELERMMLETDENTASYANVFANINDIDIRNLSNDLIEGMTTSTADGLTEEILLSEGYTKIEKTDGKYIFEKSNENEYILVDFSENIRIVYALDDGTRRKARHLAPSIEALQQATKKAKEAVDKIVMSAEHVRPFVDYLIKKNSAELCKYAKLGQEYAKGNSVVDLILKKQCLEKVRTLSWCQTQLRSVMKYIDRLKVGKIVGVAGSLYDLIDTGYQGIKEYNDWKALYNKVPECEKSKDLSKSTRDAIKAREISCLSYYIGNINMIFADLALTITGISFVPETAGSSLIPACVALGVTVARIALNNVYEKNRDNFIATTEKTFATIKEKCKEDDDEEDDEGDDDKDKDKHPQPKTPIEDPSGYVYEAVPTNRLKDVKATIYFNQDNPTKWEAEEYGEVNPQITDETGLYAWDVPLGTWKVVFEKEGYETAQTEWMPVPPPQLEINIPMSHAAAPCVEDAKGTESGVSLTFSKYMKPDALLKNNRISVACNGQDVRGSIEMLNLEENPLNGEEFASKVKFAPNTPFKTSDDVIITVKKEVESYAGKQMESDFVQHIKIESEITDILCDSVVAVRYQQSGVLELSATPADKAAGKSVYVVSTAPMIASCSSSAKFDQNGKASIQIEGKLPGTAILRFAIPETDKEKYAEINVVTDEDEIAKAPKASKLNGASFDNDYLLSLTSATKGATIHYTLDGSCPCDEQKRIKYTGPFALPIGDITLKTIAVREGLADSDISEYKYKVVAGTNGIKVVETVPDCEITFQDGAVVVSGAMGATCIVYDVQGRELGKRSSMGSTARIKVPKSDFYIVSINFGNDQTIVRKIKP